MLLGDINENGKLDEQDREWIGSLGSFVVNFSPYYSERDEWWITCYYSIMSDINIDATADVMDSELIAWYCLGYDPITNHIRKYNMIISDIIE